MHGYVCPVMNLYSHDFLTPLSKLWALHVFLIISQAKTPQSLGTKAKQNGQAFCY